MFAKSDSLCFAVLGESIKVYAFGSQWNEQYVTNIQMKMLMYQSKGLTQMAKMLFG